MNREARRPTSRQRLGLRVLLHRFFRATDLPIPLNRFLQFPAIEESGAAPPQSKT